ncbi:MAG: Crp/Fnr family transcriptional regulator [Lachnospiraceae bacterium]
MKKITEKLKHVNLFRGISTADLERLPEVLSFVLRTYQADEYILRAGDTTSSLGIVLSGMAHILKEDFWGNRTILSNILPGEVFAETYACVPDEPVGVNVLAIEETEVFFLNIRDIIASADAGHTFYHRFLQNLLAVLASKNLMLTKKIEHTSKRSTREKLLSYLSAESQKSRSVSFVIPYDRQQLADYLTVDRSAMSNELGKLRDEGLLVFHKNHFELKGSHLPL